MEQLFSVEIDTNDKNLAAALMNREQEPAVGTTININDDLSIRFEGHYIRKLGNNPNTISLLVSIQSEAVLQSLVNYLFDRVENRVTQLRINRKVIESNRERAALAIGEEFSRQTE